MKNKELERSCSVFYKNYCTFSGCMENFDIGALICALPIMPCWFIDGISECLCDYSPCTCFSWIPPRFSHFPYSYLDTEKLSPEERIHLNSFDEKFFENFGFCLKELHYLKISGSDWLSNRDKGPIILQKFYINGWKEVDLAPLTRAWKEAALRVLSLELFELWWAEPKSLMEFLTTILQLKHLRELDLSNNGLFSKLNETDCELLGKLVTKSKITKLKIFDWGYHDWDRSISFLIPNKSQKYSLNLKAFLKGLENNTQLIKLDCTIPENYRFRDENQYREHQEYFGNVCQKLQNILDENMLSMKRREALLFGFHKRLGQDSALKVLYAKDELGHSMFDRNNFFQVFEFADCPVSKRLANENDVEIFEARETVRC